MSILFSLEMDTCIANEVLVTVFLKIISESCLLVFQI